MKIKLINPKNENLASNFKGGGIAKGIASVFFGFSSFAKTFSIPLNLCVLAAHTPKDIDVSIVDEMVESLDFSENIDLVGITSMTCTAPRAYAIAKKYRDLGIKVVMGGMHTSALPEEALKHVDAVVVGEAEEVWPKLLKDFYSNQLQNIYRSNSLLDLNNLPFAKRELLNPNNYVFYNAVQTTRGCPFNCSFCSVSTFFGKNYRFRPLNNVINEIKTLNGKFIYFVDDNIVGNSKYAKELFSALIPLNIYWVGYSSISIANNEELLGLAAKSGCIALLIGFESVSKNSLKEAEKQNSPDEYYALVKKLHKYGIAIWGSFVYGFDSDNDANLKETLKFSELAKLEFAQFFFLTPLPGTPLFKKLKGQNRLLTNDWAKYNLENIVFKPTNISLSQLYKLYEYSWLQFYSFGSILKRIGLFRKSFRHFLIILLSNFVMRKVTRLIKNKWRNEIKQFKS